MKILRHFAAFLYLAVGYWFIYCLLGFILLFLPYAKSDGGISMSSNQGVHVVTFNGHPGDLVALLYVSDAGKKSLDFATSTESTSSASTSFRWDNAYFHFLAASLFALISIPILKCLLRDRKVEQDVAPDG